MLAGEGGGVHRVYCLRRGHIAFVEKGVQLGRERKRTVDTEKVRCKGGRRDQGRKGVAMVLSLIHI